jgi:hypothetical protein
LLKIADYAAREKEKKKRLENWVIPKTPSPCTLNHLAVMVGGNGTQNPP